MRSTCAALLLLLLASPARAEERDPNTGLAIDRGWELVAAHCGACHSYKLVTSQRGDAEFWTRTIRWMQKTQKLWPIPTEQEALIVGYLAKHYDETDWGRRPPLSQSLMPPE